MKTITLELEEARLFEQLVVNELRKAREYMQDYPEYIENEDTLYANWLMAVRNKLRDQLGADQ